MKKVVLTVSLFVLCLSLSALAQSQCEADGSLAANCGWESLPDFAGWTRSGDATFTTIEGGPVAHSGARGLQTGPGTALGCFEQNVPTDAGALYDLSFWLRNQDAPNQFQVSWNGAVIYDQTNMPTFPYTSSAALPVGDTSVFIGLAASDDTTTNLKFCFFNPPDYFHLDDVDVLAE
ncbi:MAG: hypothetical protein HYR55_18985 [Acidobacteria bacterium]|nr:hypothetical protein [Acidobacteriota bacterium]MBI3657456.1 hypothetical protein [Acidobacteriota bacterium]